MDKVEHSAYHLAQINVARMLGPLDSPRLRDFVRHLEPINALADAAPGFVWRLVGEGDDATDVRAFEEDLLLINLSVWTTPEALKTYVYHSPHAALLRRRREWFAPMREVHTALWWVPVGHHPTPAEARERLEHLRVHGPSAHAFRFQDTFAPPALNPAPA